MRPNLSSLPIDQSTDLLLDRMFEVSESEPKSWERGSPDPDQVIELDNCVARRWGSGRRVLLVHGLEGRFSQFAPIMKQLDPSIYEVTALDMPGHGLASSFQNNPLESAKAVMHASEKFGPFDAIIAHSQGCIAALYALGQGVSTSRLILISPLTSVETHLRRMCKQVQLPKDGIGVLLRKVEQSVGVPVSAFEAVNLMKGRRDATLIIHDTHDRKVNVWSSRAIYVANQNSRYLETSGLGHRRILKDPRVVAETVRFVSAKRDQIEFTLSEEIGAVGGLQHDIVAARNRARNNKG